jgi:putative transposase
MASRGTRYSEEQIIRILKEVESGTSVAEVCRKYGVSEQTVYRWRSKYGGLETSELQRLRELETENARLKRIVAQQVLDLDALKELVSKKW